MSSASAYPQPPSSSSANPSTEANAIEIARLQERVTALHTLLDERDKQVKIAAEAASKATEKAEHAQQQVNTTQNEFRGALKDQAANFVTKADLDAAKERIALLEKSGAVGIGRTGGLTAVQAFIFQLLPLLLAAVMAAAFFLKK